MNFDYNTYNLLNYFFRSFKMFVCCCHSNNIPPVPTKEDLREDVKDDEAQ